MNLIELLKELSAKEWKAFEDFVNSPAFNKSEKIIELLAILKYFCSNFEDETLLQEHISQQLFPKIEGNTDKNISNITTKLLRLLEQFFAFQYWQKDENLHDYYLLQNLLKRNKNDIAKQNLDKIARKRDKQKQKSFAFYDSKVLLLEQKYRYSLRQKKPIKCANLQDNSDALDAAYILKKLKYACLITHREKNYEVKHDIGLLDEILQFVEAKRLYEKAAIDIYYTCLKMLRSENNDSEAEKLKTLLATNSDVLNENELANLYQLIIFFYNAKIDKQTRDFEKMLSIYLLMLEKGWLNDGIFLHHKNLNNVIICALRAKNFEYAKNLTQSSSEKIEPSFKKIFLDFNMGKLEFYQQNYELASGHFEQIESSTIFYELHRRVYLLKSYYLSDNFLFYSRVDSFKQFLRDTKSITNDVKREHSSFIRFLARLNKVKDLSNRNDITKLEGLQVQILKTRVLKEKEWLLAKIKSILL